MDNIKFSQLDIVDPAVDPNTLNADQWVDTKPLISTIDPIKGAEMGLLSPEATNEEIYDRGLIMSHMRDQVNIQEDGVYCPIDHKANPELKKLYTPCPTCGRKLLRFGWD